MTARSSHLRIFSATDDIRSPTFMFRKFSIAALAFLAAFGAYPAKAETPILAGPPPWQDNASVYLNLERASEATSASAVYVEEKIAASPPAAGQPPLPPTAPPPFDSQVQPAVHQLPAPVAANDVQRRLRPPTLSPTIDLGQATRTGATSPTPSLLPKWESLSTSVSATAIVIGGFLLCAWLLRRGVRKSGAALPRDVVAVLGRMPLAARNVAQLLRVGNKLVLISITPAGAETLTEVTDPAEVDRLIGLCHQSDPHSTTKAFEQVLQQMSLEPAYAPNHDFRGGARA